MAKSKIPSKIVEELNRQYNHELGASRAYTALAIWCGLKHLQGFAEYFGKQAQEEQAHAGKILRHLLDRGMTPELVALPAPKQEFRSLLEVAQQAQALEQANTQGIHAVYEAALALKDYPVQIFMQWFINEQVEEEAWCAEMVDRVQAASCAGSLSDLDRHLDRLLGESTPAGT